MQRRTVSFRQYRAFDLSVFAVLLIVFEVVAFNAATKWFPDQLYTVSLVPALVAVVFMRWDFFGLFHALIGGVVYAYLAAGTGLQFLCYMCGNLFSIFAVLLLKAVGKEAIRSNSILSMLFAAFVAFCMQLGRVAVAFVSGFELKAGVSFITTDVLSGIFAVVIVMITRKLDGIFEDQKTYLLRVQKESREERGTN